MDKLNLHDAILLICKETGINPELILKRGKPGPLQREIRKQAETYIAGKLDLSKVEVFNRPIEKIEVENKEIPIIKKIEFDSKLMKFGGLGKLSSESKKELDNWVNNMNPSLKRFLNV